MCLKKKKNSGRRKKDKGNLLNVELIFK